ncbi:adenylate kinase [Enterococcus dongliensis]|uniref:adenylate kinase n=1 Tax=Enterococcus dongliensis TaxID=2559925 RepID=UPI00288E9098|nr:adenylate kinase [Enterococcus dongliensis]MDT2612506.1 adenylate kinase [Enterococcus dongliensis]MDT2639174.1 adenylate kinase [Enterococcus dongliensis]
MQKVIVIGSPGAGKSTFSRKLREKTGLSLYYLDRFWHKSNQTTVSREEFVQQLAKITKREEWIIDGNYLHTLDLRLAECDTVFLLDYPLSVCLAGVKSRIGKVREDLPWIETEFDEEFKQWIIDFPNNQLPQIYRLLDQYKETKNLIIFKSREEAEKYLQETF